MVTMTMVVMGDTCVRSITVIHTIIRLLCGPEAIVTMAMVVMGGMCVRSITAICIYTE